MWPTLSDYARRLESEQVKQAVKGPGLRDQELKSVQQTKGPGSRHWGCQWLESSHTLARGAIRGSESQVVVLAASKQVSALLDREPCGHS